MEIQQMNIDGNGFCLNQYKRAAEFLLKNQR